MHLNHALKTQEIPFDIFGLCHCSADVVSLARIRRAFKEPALDVLWEEVDDLWPLGQSIRYGP